MSGDHDEYMNNAEAQAMITQLALEETIAQQRQQIADLTAALTPFTATDDSPWGRILAWIVEGAADRAEGIAMAKRVQNWRVAAQAALALPPDPREEPARAEGRTED